MYKITGPQFSFRATDSLSLLSEVFWRVPLGPPLLSMILIGTSGMFFATHSSTGLVQHSIWFGIIRCRITIFSFHACTSLMLLVIVSQYQGVLDMSSAHLPGPNLKSGSHTSMILRRIIIASWLMKKFEFQRCGQLN